mmetsp:Transcript_35801/g.73579  ORF Transcript_35801/g.73579 Transcript_35801/m.73579 type:complete len:242 (-) Transcript_35801:39-764(-)
MTEIVGLEDGLNLLTDLVNSMQINNSMQIAAAYTLVYNMATQKEPYNWRAEIYSLHATLHVRMLQPTCAVIESMDYGEAVLLAILDGWRNFKLYRKMLKRVFSYLDRYYVLQESLPNLTNQADECFLKSLYLPLRWSAMKSLPLSRESTIDSFVAMVNTLGDEEIAAIGEKEKKCIACRSWSQRRSLMKVMSAAGILNLANFDNNNAAGTIAGEEEENINNSSLISVLGNNDLFKKVISYL